MKRLKLKKIDEMARIMPILSELERRNLLGGYHIVIETQRQASGPNSTWSTYTATAYDNCGSVVGTTTGYFLEPTTNHDLETTAGSDTAIQAGTYTVSQNSNGVYQLNGVEGRSGIQIHPGNYGSDTTGCFLPGSSTGSFSNGDFYVSQSGDATKTLYSFLDQYGLDGISMVISGCR